MICIYAESHLCALTLIFYTCICIPFLETAQFILRIFRFLGNPHYLPLENAQIEETPICDLDLPVSLFQSGNGNRGEAENHVSEERCVICLMEFEKEDLVNKLPRCGHVFHVECMEKWLDRFHYTCPLCRCFLLHLSSSPCKIPASTPCP